MKNASIFALALLFVVPQAGAANTNCQLVNGLLPADCQPANQNADYGQNIGPNIVTSSTDIGATGFSIRIGDTSTPTRNALPVETVGRLLDDMGLHVRFDRLGARPKLAVATMGLRENLRPGEHVAFQTASNYPAWIKSSVINIYDADTGEVIDRVAVSPNSTTSWTAPQKEGRYAYAYEVRDENGRRDITRAVALIVHNQADDPGEVTAQSTTAFLKDDMTARRAIKVHGGSVLITGDDLPPGVTLRVLGETVNSGPERKFAMERILPPGLHDVHVHGQGNGRSDTMTEMVDIPQSDWFYTGMIDITIGENFDQGRVAGYAEGVLASGTRIGISIDTDERELEKLFTDFFERDPKRVLKDIDPSKPFLTYGDGSRREDLAPTSGRLYARVENHQGYAQWGDFTTDPLLKGLAQNTRTLYGASAAWSSFEQTERDEARYSAAAYGAAAETSAQRDVFKATGGSAYFLSRRDIVKDSERVWVEYRDSISGQVLETVPLSPFEDYRFNTLQGNIFLDSAITPPPHLGSNVESYILVRYEYVPSTPVNGVHAGGRAEAWVSDTLRVGVEGQLDTSSLTDTKVIGLDVLYAPTEYSSLLLEAAKSEGPGFGQTSSDNSGLVGTTQTPTGNAQTAYAYKITGQIGLEDVGLPDGQLSFFYAQEDNGFAAPDGVITADRTRGRISADVPMSERTRLSFGGRFENNKGGLHEQEIFAGWHLGDDKTYTQFQVSHEERSDASGNTERVGERTQIEARYNKTVNDSLTWWVYGQGTLRHTQTLGEDHRIGAGMERQLNDTTSIIGDVSYGTLGWGGELGFSQSDENGSRRLSYRLDPERVLDNPTPGKDRGVIVMSGERNVNEKVNTLSEIQYDAFGDQPSMTSFHGLTWTPREGWEHEFGFVYGTGVTDTMDDVKKTGLSYGMRHSSEGRSFALRGEYIRDRSTDQANANDNQDTYVLKINGENKISENWHLIGNLNALYVDSKSIGVKDSHYVEGELGYAYRPSDSDKTIGLLSYTFLHDQPAAGQVNYDGDTDGAGQTSHILNAFLSRDLNEHWTISGKYGVRYRTLAATQDTDEVTSLSQLGIVRADYHLTHKWDAMAEFRGMWHNNSSSEFSTLLGVTRQVNTNLRLGVGHAWGTVSDDLRSVNPSKEGLFFNLTSSF